MTAASHVHVVSQLYPIRRDEYFQTYMWMSWYFSGADFHTLDSYAPLEGMNNINVLIPFKWGGIEGLGLQLS